MVPLFGCEVLPHGHEVPLDDHGVFHVDRAELDCLVGLLYYLGCFLSEQTMAFVAYLLVAL